MNVPWWCAECFGNVCSECQADYKRNPRGRTRWWPKQWGTTTRAMWPPACFLDHRENAKISFSKTLWSASCLSDCKKGQRDVALRFWLEMFQAAVIQCKEARAGCDLYRPVCPYMLHAICTAMHDLAESSVKVRAKVKHMWANRQLTVSYLEYSYSTPQFHRRKEDPS